MSSAQWQEKSYQSAAPLELGAKAITRIDFVIKIDFHQVLVPTKALLISPQTLTHATM